MTYYRSPGGTELTCPTFVCDVCGKPIQRDSPGSDALRGAGIVVWWPEWSDDSLSMPPLCFVHKGACDERIQAERGHSCWDDLDSFLQELGHNLTHPFEPGGRLRVPTINPDRRDVQADDSPLIGQTTTEGK